MKQINVKLLAVLFLTTVLTLAGAFLLYRFQNQSNAESLLTRADASAAEGDLNESIKMLGRYVSLRPDDHQRYADLARSLHKLVDERYKEGNFNATLFSNAFSTTEEAVRRNPEDRDFRRAAIDFQMRYGRYKDAASHLQTLLQGDDADDPELVVKLARCYVGIQKDAEAIPLLAKLIGYDADNRTFVSAPAAGEANEDAYNMLAQIYLLKKGDPTSSNVVIDQLVKVSPDSYRAHLMRCQHYRAQDKSRFQPVIDEEIEQALRLAPDEPITLLTAAEKCLVENDLIRSKELLDRCVAKHPENIHSYQVLASWALKTGDAESAIAYLNQGLQIEENEPSLLWAKANIELDRNKLDDLQKTRDRLSSINYQRSLLDFLDARKELALENWHRAAEMLEEVRPKIEQYRPAWVPGLDGNLAVCYEKLGQRDLQAKACQRILDKDPTNLAARWGKVESLLATKQIDKVLAEYSLLEGQLRGETVQMTTAMVVARLQLELLQQDQLPKSQRSYKEAEQFAKNIVDLGLHRNIGAAKVLRAYFAAIGEPEKGKALVQRVRDTSPDDIGGLLEKISKIAKDEGVEAALATLDQATEDGTSAATGDPVSLRLLRCELLGRIRPEEAREQLAVLESDLKSMPEKQQVAVVRGMGRIYLYLLNDFASTRRLWTDLAERLPKDINVRLSAFELAAQDNDEEGMNDAIQLIEELEGRNSEQADWARAFLIAWRVRNDKADRSELDEALALVDHAIAMRDSWEALYRLQGDIQVLLGNSEAAIESLERALDLSGGKPSVYQTLARLYYDTGQLSLAEEMLDELPEQMWSKLDQRIYLDAQARRGNLPEELPYDKESKDPDEHFWYGKLLTNVGRLDQAEAAFDRGLAIAPERVDGYLAKLRILVKESKVDEAKELIQEAELRIDEKQRNAFLGESHALLKEWDKAQQYMAAALEEKPDSVALKRGLADVLLRANQGQEAVKYLDDIIDSGNETPGSSRNPSVLWARRMKARVLASAGSYHEFTQALELIDQNANADGLLSPTDMVLWASLCNARPDGFSRQQAIKKLEQTAEKRELVEAESRNLADLYRRQDRWPECKSVMLGLLAKDSKNLTLLDPWLSWLLERDELDMASKWIDNCPDGSVAKIRTMAQLDARRGNQDRAIRRLAALIPKDLKPIDADRLMVVAKILEQLSEYDDRAIDLSERVWRRFVAMRPDASLEFAAFLARNGNQQRIAESLDLCGKAIEQGHASEGLQLAVAILRRNRNNPGYVTKFEPVVRSWFEAVQKSHPDDPSIMIQRSEFEDVLGNDSESQEWLRKYLSENSNVTNYQRAIVSNNLAYMLALKGEKDESYELIQVAMKILGPTADLLDTLGIVYLARGQDEQAIRQIRASIGDGGVTSFKYVHLAMAYDANGEYKKSAEAVIKACEKGLDLKQLSRLEKATYDKLIDNLIKHDVITREQVDKAIEEGLK